MFVGLARTVYIHRIWPYAWCLIHFLPQIPCIHRMYMVLDNPTNLAYAQGTWSSEEPKSIWPYMYYYQLSSGDGLKSSPQPSWSSLIFYFPFGGGVLRYPVPKWLLFLNYCGSDVHWLHSSFCHIFHISYIIQSLPEPYVYAVYLTVYSTIFCQKYLIGVHRI